MVWTESELSRGDKARGDAWKGTEQHRLWNNTGAAVRCLRQSTPGVMRVRQSGLQTTDATKKNNLKCNQAPQPVHPPGPEGLAPSLLGVRARVDYQLSLRAVGPFLVRLIPGT
jgi:hypothetical protein